MCSLNYLGFAEKCVPKIGRDLDMTLTHQCRPGALYGPVILDLSLAMVHRAVVDAFKGYINYKTPPSWTVIDI
jgi:predicted metal-dependent HD superfamily phosphohydrolase